MPDWWQSWIPQNIRNIALVSLSVLLLPLSAITWLLAEAGNLVGYVKLPFRGRNSDHSSRVLITGVGMTKGLFLARTMFLGGCTVYAGDFDRNGNMNSGRFSRAVSEYHRLKNPSTAGSQAYIDQIVGLVKTRGIDVWISCSGVATAIEDALVAESLIESTNCKVVQFSRPVIESLDDKYLFMKQTSDFDLAGIEWFSISSVDDILPLAKQIIYKHLHQKTRYIIKSASMDDASRGSLPLLSSDDPQTISILESLDLSKDRQWIVQEFVESGEEYCTHAVIVDGQVKAFTACRSESVLMHYQALNSDTVLFKAMLEFTKTYAVKLNRIQPRLTGHLSFDFLVKYTETDGGFVGRLVPIECNPRCHTAVVLFRGLEEQLAACYLSVMGPSNLGKSEGTILTTDEDKDGGGYYWLAHDLVALVIMPLLNTITTPSWIALAQVVSQSSEAISHLLTWKDPTFEWWDPLPWLVLNHVYWPSELMLASFRGVRWKQLNVSTTKIFRC